jgi:hypothetical protein
LEFGGKILILKGGEFTFLKILEKMGNVWQRLLVIKKKKKNWEGKILILKGL